MDTTTVATAPSLWSLVVPIALVLLVFGVGMYALGLARRHDADKRQQIKEREEAARFQRQLNEYIARNGGAPVLPGTSTTDWPPPMTPEQRAIYRRHGSDG